MSLINSFVHNIEDLLLWLSTGIGQRVESYSDLETADSKHVVVGKDSSLMSVIRLDGFKRFIGSTEFAFLSERLGEIFQPYLSSPGHHIHFFFSQEQEGLKEFIEDALQPAMRTAKRVGLSIDDIFKARVEVLSEYIAIEKTFIVLWTSTDCIEKNHLKSIRKQHYDALKQLNIPRAKQAQNVLGVLPEIRNIHDSLVQTIFEDLRHLGYYADLLNVHQVLHEVRRGIDPHFTSDEWQPYVPGDTIPATVPYDDSMNDLSHLMWPNLDKQIFPRGGSNLGPNKAKIGDLIYAPLYIELFPKDIQPFYELFRRFLTSRMPWRIAFYLSGDGIKITNSKNILAQFLTMASIHNRLLVDAHKLLKNLHDRSDNPVVKLTVCLTTWAPEGEERLLSERVSRMAKAVQSWGSCEVRDVSGDAFGTTLSSVPGLTKSPLATASAAPLSEAIPMLPWMRPASPWSAGAMLFRTPDGKLWPFQPGSNQQVSWIDIIYARSGSGKSVLLNAMNLGLCLSPGLSSLPRIAIIDIGPSSKGFISLLREGLPKEKQHEVVYKRLRMEDSYAINPFDTQLGSRFPTKLHRAFLINFLSLLLVDNIVDRPFEGVSSMLSMIVDETYKRYSDDEQPKVYVPHAEEEIEAYLSTIPEVSTEGFTWWQLTDLLFRNGKRKLAMLAQRQAMPTVSDTISIAHAHGIKDLFGHVQTPSQEDYVSYYCRVISSVIRNYPTLTMVTRLNIEDSRIVALDLDEVAKSGSTAADKQTAITYMLARHILSQHFFLHIDDVEKFPALYRDFHRGRTKEIMEEPKRIVLDEFHRTARSPVVRDQVTQDMREGRKWKIHVALCSQSLSDFDKLMIEFATSIFIMDSGSALSVEETCKTFGLSDTEKKALVARVHGPTSEGATFVAQFVTKDGLNTQLLTSTISALELWAFSTTTEDVFIRDTLYDRIGPVAARQLLAHQFPKGSAVREIETELKNDSMLTIAEVCDNIVRDLYKIYKRKLHEKNFENLEEIFDDEKKLGRE